MVHRGAWFIVGRGPCLPQTALPLIGHAVKTIIPTPNNFSFYHLIFLLCNGVNGKLFLVDSYHIFACPLISNAVISGTPALCIRLFLIAAA